MTKFNLLLTNGIYFLTMAFFVSCGTPEEKDRSDSRNDEKVCIESVFEIDNTLGEIRNHACEKITLEKTIHDYADGLLKIDFSQCPKAFKQAFEKHRQAWLELIPLAKKYPDMRGEMHDLFDELEKSDDAETFKPLLKNIWDTWGEVEAASK